MPFLQLNRFLTLILKMFTWPSPLFEKIRNFKILLFLYIIIKRSLFECSPGLSLVSDHFKNNLDSNFFQRGGKSEDEDK